MLMDADWAAGLICRATFCSREPQRGGPAFTPEALSIRLSALATSDPAIFLERYGDVLSEEELSLFDPLADEYCVDFHLRRLRRTAAQSATLTRNRRFRALAHLEGSGYFEDARMLQRAPELYTELVGRFCPDRIVVDEDANFEGLADAERAAGSLVEVEGPTDTARDATHCSCSSAVSVVYDEQDVQGREDGEEDDCESDEGYVCGYMAKGGIDGGDADADDADDDDNDDDDDAYTARGTAFLAQERRAEKRRAEADSDSSGLVGRPSRRGLPESERQRRRELLLQAMKERFLSGADALWFDYATVDGNAAYDDLEQQSRDAEDQYFDEESEEEQME
uniref:CCD97-like C-terminal domain-containing protein n=1 Tax=Coccolithus braarudii TaxID=221442 RepID=A0A7S0LR88_9EUKA|mmetsp:Transcript_51295/g.109616  ORF Transcript_51295/g.109616 Transcript_51295/m.109616 type:complete len:338 (+) Transcript_51295:8-1021(+)